MLLNVNLNTTATPPTETRPNPEAAELKAPASVQEEVETDLVNEEEATVASKIKEHYILLLKVNNNGCRS